MGCGDDDESCELDHGDSVETEIASGAVDIKNCDGEIKDDDENENMGFYDVEIVLADEEEDEDEDWCLVAEME